jgi:RNA polymerase sigma-70 factor (ECF subfamily)
MDTFRATSLNEVSDSKLILATKSGDTEAFDELFLRYKRKVFAVAQRIVNNREDAEDVVQESFHKAFLHLSTFQEKSQFSTWLTRIAMNESFMVLRRRKRTLEVSQESAADDEKSIAATFVDQNPNPEQSYWRQEREKFLAGAIDRLSPKLQSTILLYDIKEYSVNETAKILGLTIAAVKSRLNHGREKLRGKMNPGLLQGSSHDGVHGNMGVPGYEAERFAENHA